MHPRRQTSNRALPQTRLQAQEQARHEPPSRRVPPPRRSANRHDSPSQQGNKLLRRTPPQRHQSPSSHQDVPKSTRNSNKQSNQSRQNENNNISRANNNNNNHNNRSANNNNNIRTQHVSSDRYARRRNNNYLTTDNSRPDVTKGFAVHESTIALVIQLPVDCLAAVTMDDFTNILIPICDEILDSNSDSFRFSHDYRRLVSAISKTKFVSDSYNALCCRINNFCQKIPNDISKCSTAVDIGHYWMSVEDKISKISLIFETLSFKNKKIPEVFSQCCANAFRSNVDIFQTAAALVVASYNELRPSNDESSLTDASHFLKETSLFSEYFVPLFVDSVLSYVGPIVDHSFEEDPFSDYLQFANELTANEIQLASVFDYFTCIGQLADRLHKLTFSTKIESIFGRCLRTLLQEQDIDSICACSKLSRSTNTFDRFIHEMALLFEEEVVDTFKSDDPIQEILRLHRTLTMFCERACGPQSTRTVRLAFERGFNSEPETVARLLAMSVNRIFSATSNLTSYSTSNSTSNLASNSTSSEAPNSTMDSTVISNFDVVEQYIALFRMLSLNDVFETYHTQLLTRRILVMKDEMLGPETFFVDKLRLQCGVEYTKRMQDLLLDRAQSRKIVADFLRERPKMPSIFRSLVISAEIAKSWASLKNVKMTLPKEISRVLLEFSSYYKSVMSRRKIVWNLQLTTVKLENQPNVKPASKTSKTTNKNKNSIKTANNKTSHKTKNNKNKIEINNKNKDKNKGINNNISDDDDDDDISDENSDNDNNDVNNENIRSVSGGGLKIKCSGDFAIVLMSFNGKVSQTLSEIVETVGGQEEDVLSRLRLLKSKKASKIVSFSEQSGEYKINPNKYMNAPNGECLNFNFIFPQMTEVIEEKAKSTIVDNQDNQLDAAIVSVAKAEKSIEKDFLFNRVIGMVRFKVNHDFFETRLQILSRKEFIKIDPAGRVHYKP